MVGEGIGGFAVIASHAVARILTSSNHTVIAEAKHAIHVPQMVYLEITDEAKAALQQDVYDGTNLVVQAFSQNDVNNLLWNIAGAITSYYEGVNVWVDDWDIFLPDYYSTVTFTTNEANPLIWGRAYSDPPDFGNVNIDDTARVYVHPPRNAFSNEFAQVQVTPPYTVEEQIFTFSLVAAHEMGHLLGLVSSNDVLRGEGAHNRPLLTHLQIMNSGTFEPFTNKIGRTAGGAPWVFREINHEYLKFIMPIPQ